MPLLRLESILRQLNRTNYLPIRSIPLHRNYDSGRGRYRGRVRQAFTDLTAVCEAAGGSLNHIAKANVFLTDLTTFPWSTGSWRSLRSTLHCASGDRGLGAPKGAVSGSTGLW